MLYNYNKETFKIEQFDNYVKLYCKAENRWSSGWTYIGKFNTVEKAQVAAKKYTN